MLAEKQARPVIWTYWWNLGRAPTLYEFIRMERYLSEQVGIKVDLVMKKTLLPYIGKRILAEVVAV
jgi:predicted nucleotidyltransferase